MNIIFKVEGGLGKSIASTAFVKKIKQKYPDSNLIVITFWKDVFLNNPNVDVCLGTSEMSGMYSKYIKGKETLFLIENPYFNTLHMNNKQHLLQSWFDMIGEKYNGEKPELFFTIQEEQYYAQQFKTPKPLFMIHPNGGMPSTKKDKYNWARDMPPNVVQAIIDKYSEDYTVGVIRTKEQIKYNNCVDLVEKWRQVAIGMKYSAKRLLIDSSFQHIAAALDLPSVVLWNVTDPKVFGYDMHNNIKSNAYTKDTESRSLFFDYDIDEPLQTMPYNSFNEIYNTEEIIKIISNQ